MADRTNDERLRITADLGFRLHDDEVRAIAAELLAARARIAKLEQEPPMAMIDFGVGVNWKAINEERQSVCAALQGIATALATAVGAEECPPVTAGNLHAIVDECLARIARLAHRRYQQTERIVDAGSLPSHLSIAEDFETVLDEVRRENQQLRAEVERLRGQLHADDQRAWEALGKPEGTYDTTNVQRLCAEVERLRADLREALELLRELGRPDHGDDLDARYVAFLEKHKEMDQ